MTTVAVTATDFKHAILKVANNKNMTIMNQSRKMELRFGMPGENYSLNMCIILYVLFNTTLSCLYNVNKISLTTKFLVYQ